MVRLKRHTILWKITLRINGWLEKKCCKRIYEYNDLDWKFPILSKLEMITRKMCR